MKRTLALGGAVAGMLAAAAVAAPAHAAPTDAAPALNLANTKFAAQQVVQYWIAEKKANLINATPYNVETTLSTRGVSAKTVTSASDKPGVVGSSGDQKAATAKTKNINLPRTVGKVFFTGADGKPHWCSATSIQNGYKNLVVTAGHCVYNTKANADTLDNWVFIPGYYQGKTPWGIYVGKTAYVHSDYKVFEDGDRDYAFVTVYNGVLPTDGTGVDKDYKSPLYNTRAEAYAALRKLQNDKSTAWSKLWVRKVEVKQRHHHGRGWGHQGKHNKPEYEEQIVAATVAEVKEAHPGVKLTADNLTLKDGWAAKTEEISAKEYGTKNLLKPSYETADAVFFQKLVEKEVKIGNSTKKVKVPVYYKRTFTKTVRVEKPRPTPTPKPVKKIYKWQVVGKKVTVALKDVGRLGDNVGGQGLAYNQKVGTAVFMFGYPSGSHPDGSYAFTGKTMKWSYGKTFRVAPIASIKGEELIGLKSSFTGEGAIGSPWLYRYSNAKRLGYVTGVTMGVSDTDGNNRIDTSISSYFDGETLAVYKAAANNASGKIV